MKYNIWYSIHTLFGKLDTSMIYQHQLFYKSVDELLSAMKEKNILRYILIMERPLTVKIYFVMC